MIYVNDTSGNTVNLYGGSFVVRGWTFGNVNSNPQNVIVSGLVYGQAYSFNVTLTL